jgi:GPI-anchor transamidase subunit GAA1
MAPTFPQFSLARVRSYIFRLPLFTRLVISIIVFFWVANIPSFWDLQKWGALIPNEVGLSSCENRQWKSLYHIQISLSANELMRPVYRTNTFPLIHKGLLHALLNIIALTPLLERFEAEHGTLTSLLLFFGRK